MITQSYDKLIDKHVFVYLLGFVFSCISYKIEREKHIVHWFSELFTRLDVTSFNHLDQYEEEEIKESDLFRLYFII